MESLLDFVTLAWGLAAEQLVEGGLFWHLTIKVFYYYFLETQVRKNLECSI